MGSLASSRVFRLRWLAGVLVSAGAVAACSTPPSAGSTTASVPKPAAALTALPRNLVPIAKPELDIGRRDPAIPTAGSLYFQPTADQLAARESLLAAVQDPASPLFHKWITPEEFAARFGAKPADIARVTAWLAGQGFTLDTPSPLGTRVGFRGTSGQVEAAFRTEFHNYQVGRVKHYAMATAPQVPTELAPVVMGLRGFHDFHPHPMNRGRRAPRPQYNDTNYGLTLGPSDFQVLYDTRSLVAAGSDGTGVNIAVIGQTWIIPSDIATFRTKFGITPHETDINVPNTGSKTAVSDNDVGEAELDLEWSSAVAPGANILFVYASGNGDYSVDDAVVYAVEQGTKLAPGVGNGGAQIISESYGGCELSYSSVDGDVDSEIAAAANLQGITYIAASGDDGAEGCYDPAYGGTPGRYTGPPASLPGVTGVGGTDFCSPPDPNFPYSCTFSANPPIAVAAPYFDLTANVALEYPQPPGQPTLESVWNDSVADPTLGADYWSAGGGAPSIIFPKPFYQYGTTINDGVRDVPDVALTASPDNVGYEVYGIGGLQDGGSGYYPIGGTSAATPSFAGIMAIVNQSVAAHGGALGLGNINPILYALQASSSGAGVFHDIVSGDNGMPCEINDAEDGGFTKDPGCPASGRYEGFSAGPGYDLASGLGSVDAKNLVTAWTSLSPTTTTLTVGATTTTVGTPITLNATVTSAATSNAVGGTVSFTFVTYQGALGPVYAGDAGVPDESWLLGTVNVTPSAGTPEGATATLTAAIPPGLSGNARLVAMYNGDTHYLASRSAPSPMTVSGSTLAIAPATVTLHPFAHTTITTTGGAPPVTWSQIGVDGTCDAEFDCTMFEAESPTQAYVVAGGAAGSITLVAIDTNGEEATVKLTVAGAAVDAGDGYPTLPTFDAGPKGGPPDPTVPDASWPVDSGSDATVPASDDAGLDASGPVLDATVEVDASNPNNGTSSGGGSSGCSCTTAGGNETSPAGLLGGLVFGAGVLARRRRRARR